MFKEYTKTIAKEFKKSIDKFEVKAVAENGTFKVIASDETVDRAGEVIKISAWDLTNYKNNPIILFGHNYWEVDNIVGKATNVYVDGTKLVVEGVFAGTEKAQIVRQLYDEGIIKTVSVGFIPKKRDEKDQRIITEAELLELSFVPIPANPNALSLQKEILEKVIEFGIMEVEKKQLSTSDALDKQMISLIKSEKNIAEDTKLWFYVASIFANDFVYNMYGEIDEDSRIDKYFRRGYEIVDGLVNLIGEDVEVEVQQERADKTNTYKENPFDEIKAMIKEIPQKIKEVANGEDDNDLDNGKSAEDKLQETKAQMQQVAKIVSDALHNIKL